MIIMVNGPPSSGKDQVCEFLKQQGFIHKEMKEQLYKDVATYYNVDYDWFMNGYTKIEKELPEEKLGGISRREAMINVSENVIKPLYGKNYYGKQTANSMEVNEDYAFSDSGFVEELDVIINKFGNEEIIFIRLYRDGSTYENDSRRYIKFAKLENIYVCGKAANVSMHEKYFFDDIVDSSGYIVHNNGGLEELYSTILDIVRTNNDRKNKKQAVQ